MSALPPKKVETELNSVVKEPSTNKDLSKIRKHLKGKKKYSYFTLLLFLRNTTEPILIFH
jgi:hypothetical protein